ncbi:hypothetical protein LINPERHAP1_LOCUS36780 [Linum perenne]
MYFLLMIQSSLDLPLLQRLRLFRSFLIGTVMFQDKRSIKPNRLFFFLQIPLLISRIQ